MDNPEPLWTLMIGGGRDGKTIRSRDYFLRFSKPLKFDVFKPRHLPKCTGILEDEIYRLRKFITGNRIDYVYALDDLKDEEVIAKLIEKYPERFQ